MRANPGGKFSRCGRTEICQFLIQAQATAQVDGYQIASLDKSEVAGVVAEALPLVVAGTVPVLPPPVPQEISTSARSTL
jgi:hypothetical protein